jgi:hypothetical protein
LRRRFLVCLLASFSHYMGASLAPVPADDVMEMSRPGHICVKMRLLIRLIRTRPAGNSRPESTDVNSRLRLLSELEIRIRVESRAIRTLIEKRLIGRQPVHAIFNWMIGLHLRNAFNKRRSGRQNSRGFRLMIGL